ncbi:MAG: hypothetical protein COY81_01060 [Candidatus Pacebacteria bacterium CG_4_10_14_0_8_um_filter_43_12]|nr:MAG: hypothetical protein COU66_01495 [Candidatus Pacebacteria bacterium CG10_big_fil_rev_8_21_14_0_10_44_11]PIY79736.1 MAG: hypothetical protein COY81_01060 [Candidatus Pacebacteria bacterium CG_4_10_14_0_8_um_filter_43_12]
MNLSRPQQMTAKFEEKIVHNSKFSQYTFELDEPHRIPFAAGQYVSIKVDERGDRRSYSICSTPDIDHGFELLIDLAPQGLGVKYLESLKFGDTVQILGPMGMFVVPDDPTEENLVFIATGAGIAPIKAMILDQLQVKHDQRPIILYWGLRYERDAFWFLELQELSQSFPNFSFHPVMSRPENADWVLCRGRVTDCLVNHPLPEKTGYYICGNAQMLTDVLTILEQKGVEITHLHHEKFY